MWLKDRILAPGPTPLPEGTRLAGAESQVYHRTEEFAGVIRDVEEKLQKLLDVNWPVISVASSGSGGMQMAAQNLVEPGTRVLAVDSGKFGRRWCEILEQLGCEVVRCEVQRGQSVKPGQIKEIIKQNPGIEVAFLTLVETSTLVRHPLEELSPLLSQNDIIVVVDAISGLGAEPFYPAEHGIDLVVGGAQKGLMAPPGLAVLAVSPAAENRARAIEPPDRYFDLTLAVERLRKDFQTPWTPPMSLLRALRSSLRKMFEEGLENVFERHRNLARVCRRAVTEAGLEIFPVQPAVSGTAVSVPPSVDGEKLREFILENCKLYIPGGQQELAGRILRIGHLGFIDYFDLLNGLAALELGLRRQDFDLENGAILSEAQTAVENIAFT